MSLKIKKLNQKHLNFVYKLRNEKKVRVNSKSKKLISFKDHKIWFDNFLKDPNSLCFIFYDKNNSKIGYVRFDEDKKKIFVSIAIIEKFRNKGLSKIILEKAINLTKADSLYAVINRKNLKSFALFESINFSKHSLSKQFIIMKKIKNT